MIRIMGKLKTEKKYKGFDYHNGTFESKIIHQTLWGNEHKEYVKGLVEHMNNYNKDYIFKIDKI